MDSYRQRAGRIFAGMRPEVLRKMRELYQRDGRKPGFLQAFREEGARYGLPPELAEAALELLDSLVHNGHLVGVIANRAHALSLQHVDSARRRGAPGGHLPPQAPPR